MDPLFESQHAFTNFHFSTLLLNNTTPHSISKLSNNNSSMNNLESYPPVLRHLDQQQQPPPPPNSDPDEEFQDPDPVPIIDLECLHHDKLEEACKNWGLFRVINHGVPLTLLKELQEVAKELFSLSFEAKEGACSGSPVTYFWGTPALTPSGRTLTRSPQNMNWVEGFDVPLSQLSHFNPQLPTLQSVRLEQYRQQLALLSFVFFHVFLHLLFPSVYWFLFLSGRPSGLSFEVSVLCSVLYACAFKKFILNLLHIIFSFIIRKLKEATYTLFL